MRTNALILAVLLVAVPAPAPAACPEQPPCTGCGCKGGPGYRGPDGQCVGFRNLAKVCGDPPDTRCVFENAPGTGANHDCALEPRKGKASGGSRQSPEPGEEGQPAPAGAKLGNAR